MREVEYRKTNAAICEDGLVGEMYYSMCQQGNEKSKLLKRILFEEDVTDTSKMKDLIYEFGSMLSVKDVTERRLFVIMASLF